MPTNVARGMGHVLLESFGADGPIRDPGDGNDIVVDRWPYFIGLITETTETRVLRAPTRIGLLAIIELAVFDGDCTIQVENGYDTAGNTDVVLGADGVLAVFISVEVSGALRWRMVGQAGTNALVTIANAMIANQSDPIAVAGHGAGAIGTEGAPVTTRRTENGTIITEIKIDLTGLRSSTTENSAVGLSTGDPSFIGRNVVANNGVIYKMELICLELPAGGQTDINVVENASGTLEFDGAAGNDFGIDSNGAHAAGRSVQNLTQSLTEGNYLYLTSGAAGTVADYTAGQLILRMYGHPTL